jgi:hypothetical protein
MGHKKCYLAGFSDTQRNDPKHDVTQLTINLQSNARLITIRMTSRSIITHITIHWLMAISIMTLCIMSHRLMNFITIVAKHNDTQLHDNQRNDPQRNDPQRNDPQHDVTQHTSNYQSSARHNNNQYNEPQYKNTHHNTLLNDNKHNDPQHNVTWTYECCKV